MRRLLLALIVLAIVAPCDAQTFRLDEAVPGHPETTVAALIGRLVPGLAIADGIARGEVDLDLPHIVDQDYLAGAPTQVDLGHVNLLAIEAEGAGRLLLFSELGEDGTAIMALFDDDLALLDAVQVGTDRFTALGEVPLLRIGPQDQAVILTSTHWNSNQGYVDTLLVLVRDGKFQPVDSIFTFSDHSCNYEQRQSLKLESKDDGQGSYWPIIATVLEIRTVSNECEQAEPLDPPFSRLVSVTYRWSASLGGYVADSDALVQLAEQSSERF